MKTLWIRTDEVKEAQGFILRVLAPEELTGEIPVRIFTGPQSVVPLSRVYDVSEDALFSLQEKYGERNVALTESGEVPESWISRSSPADPLNRIADALENIDGTLDRIVEVLEDMNITVRNIDTCIVESDYGNFLRIGGYVSHEM